MSKFIEVTDTEDFPRLVNVDVISNVHPETGKTIIVFATGYIEIKETYEAIKQKILDAKTPSRVTAEELHNAFNQFCKRNCHECKYSHVLDCGSGFAADYINQNEEELKNVQ